MVDIYSRGLSLYKMGFKFDRQEAVEVWVWQIIFWEIKFDVQPVGQTKTWYLDVGDPKNP